MEFLIGVSAFIVLLLGLLALQEWLRPKNPWICRKCRVIRVKNIGIMTNRLRHVLHPLRIARANLSGDTRRSWP